MLSKVDPKLFTKVTVVLEKLPENYTQPLKKNDTNTNEETPLSAQKEKKSLEETENKVDSFLKENCIYYKYEKVLSKETQIKEETQIKRETQIKEETKDSLKSLIKSNKLPTVSNYVNLPNRLFINRADGIVQKQNNIVPGVNSKKETDFEKETKDSLKGINETNIVKEQKPKKLLSNENIPQLRIKNQIKIDPLIELIRPAVKFEKRETITNDIGLNQTPEENNVTCTSSIQDIIDHIIDHNIDHNKDDTIGFTLPDPQISENESKQQGEHSTLTSPSTGVEEESLTNTYVSEPLKQTVERLEPENLKESPKNECTVTNSHQGSKRPRDVSPEALCELNLPPEPKKFRSSSENTNTTLVNESESHTVIKVKAPQALGIPSQDDLKDSQKVLLSINDVSLFHRSQMQFNSGTESKIAEICKVYPIFFTAQVRRDISELIKMLYETSNQLPLDQLITNDSSHLIIKNYSRTFVDTFKRILKLEQIGTDKDLLKKIIPILYLHIDKAFKMLKPEENIDFRVYMKKIFDAESFKCEPDVILEKNYEMFQKVVSTFDRWLEELFVDCELSAIVGGDDVIIIEEPEIPNVSQSSRTEFSEGKDEHSESSNEPLKHGSSEETITEQVDAVCPSNEEPHYLLCPVCREGLPLCCICKEILCCPCLLMDEPSVSFDTALETLNFCRQHASCGDTWQLWEQDLTQGANEDHDMPKDPVCWNGSCNYKAVWLCVCRTLAYCSLSCQVDHWHEQHHHDCSLQSHPKTLQDEDLDL